MFDKREIVIVSKILTVKIGVTPKQKNSNGVLLKSSSFG